MKWMNLRIIMLSKRSEPKRSAYFMNPFFIKSFGHAAWYVGS